MGEQEWAALGVQGLLGSERGVLGRLWGSFFLFSFKWFFHILTHFPWFWGCLTFYEKVILEFWHLDLTLAASTMAAWSGDLTHESNMRLCGSLACR